MSEVKFPYGPVNVERLQRIKKIILEEPDRFFMEGYGVVPCKYSPYVGELAGLCIEGASEECLPEWWQKPPCETTACIAGWANILRNEDLGRPRFENIGSESSAADWLGLEYYMTFPFPLSMFHVSDWPAEFADRYRLAGTAEEAVRAAADFIDYVCGVRPLTEEES